MKSMCTHPASGSNFAVVKMRYKASLDLENPHHLELKNLEYLMAVLLFIPDPERILMLGTAAGSLLHFLKYHYPEARITAGRYRHRTDRTIIGSGKSCHRLKRVSVMFTTMRPTILPIAINTMTWFW